MKVTIERDLSTAQCGDIAITAAEGGIGYWCAIDSYDWERWCNPAGYGDNEEVPEDFVFYTIHEIDDGTESGLPFDITPLDIRRGVQLFLTGTFGFEGRFFDDMEDFAAMDSDEADCVIQLACFGTVVYG